MLDNIYNETRNSFKICFFNKNFNFKQNATISVLHDLFLLYSLNRQNTKYVCGVLL